MRKEKSCGCIIIDENNMVLLVYENNRFFWGFPKGHVESGETEVETAKREIMEEVGLEVEVDEDKRFELNYIIRNEIDKTCVFYIARPLNKNIVKQISEIKDTKWCTFDEALELLTFEDWKKFFKEVIQKISDN